MAELQTGSPVTGNTILHLLPDFWVMLDRGPFVPVVEVQVPISPRLLASPLGGCSAILRGLGCLTSFCPSFQGKWRVSVAGAVVGKELGHSVSVSVCAWSGGD